MSRRKQVPKPAARSAALSAKGRKEALLAVSGVARAKPPEPVSVLDKGRSGRKAIVVYLIPAAKDALAALAHEHRKSLQDLGVEAFNHLLRAYGQKPIA
jgi:hypothetical protein